MTAILKCDFNSAAMAAMGLAASPAAATAPLAQKLRRVKLFMVPLILVLFPAIRL
jgi:hypothetical protein